MEGPLRPRWPGLGARGAGRSPPEAECVAAPSAAGPEPRKPRCEAAATTKHNLKHRYELQETLGKGTYGKVKRATERFFGPSGELGKPGRLGLDAAGDAALTRRGLGRRGGLWSERGFSGTPRQIPPLSPPPPTPGSSPDGSRRVFLPEALLHPVCAYFGVLIPRQQK